VTQVVGIDEAGRGPLAGPVVAGAMFDHPLLVELGVDDSKVLSVTRRTAIFAAIKAEAVPFGIGVASAGEIDEHNILNAAMLAMRRALEALEGSTGRRAELCLVDGNRDPGLMRPTQTIVGGDGKEVVIGAASIVAKTVRDRMMVDLDRRYPGYGFAQHAGYPTAAHVAALADLGPCPEHRLSFAPVRKAIVAGRHHRGRTAEDAAADRASQKGLDLIARNWRGMGGELDLVCRTDDELVIVEVRARQDGIDPLETLKDKGKWRRILKTAEELRERLRLEQLGVRFDAVSVSPEGLEWIEDAWRPASRR
jgi:ribonuclease HII